MKVEIVTHCWAKHHSQYARLLAYQCKSIADHPPSRVDVTLTVCCSQEDEHTCRIVRGWQSPINYEGYLTGSEMTLRPWFMPVDMLLPRAIGRNAAARSSSADVCWWTDADYLFGRGCLDSLEQLVGSDPLYFPQRTWISRDHAIGDRYIHHDTLLPIDLADFTAKNERRAIGGLQISPSRVAHAGYCPDSKWQKPAPPGTDTIIGFGADAAYRRQLGTKGMPIDVPNLFRIRHSVTGDRRAEKAGIPQPQ